MLRLLDNGLKAHDILLVVGWEFEGGEARAYRKGWNDDRLQVAVELLEISQHTDPRYGICVRDARARFLQRVNSNLRISIFLAKIKQDATHQSFSDILNSPWIYLRHFQQPLLVDHMLMQLRLLHCGRGQIAAAVSRSKSRLLSGRGGHLSNNCCAEATIVHREHKCEKMEGGCEQDVGRVRARRHPSKNSDKKRTGINVS